MEIEGKLRVTFGKDLNRARQRPLIVEFIGPDGMHLSVDGVRYFEGCVLNAFAQLPGGKVVSHTFFSPELQLAIKEARKKERLDESQP